MKLTLIKLLLIVLFHCLVIGINAQESAIKFAAKSLPFDNYPNILDLDDSYNWTTWSASGLNTIGLEYQRYWKNNISYKPHLGFSQNGITYIFRDSTPDIIRRYNTKYLNFGLTLNYHFKEKLRGLQVGLGPSIFTLISHKTTTHLQQNVMIQESIIRDRFNNVPILLQMEVSYSLKLIRLFNLDWGAELGYTPAFKIVGFINDKPSSNFLRRSLRFSVNIMLDREE